MNVRVPKLPRARLSQPLSQVPTMAPLRLRPGPDPVLSPRKESPNADTQEARQGRTSQRPGVGRGGGRQEQLSRCSSCYPGHPEAGRGAGPEEQVADGEPSGPERADLTLPIPSPFLGSHRDANGPRRRGLPGSEDKTRPGPACPPPGRKLPPAPHLTCPLA